MSEYLNKSKIEYFMKEALKEARKAFEKDEVPIGCVLVKNNTIIARAHNEKELTQNVTNHAELIAIKKASELVNSWRLEKVDCYVTLEPCHMCASALQQSRINNLYFASRAPKTGALISIDNFFDNKYLNHKVEYYPDILNEESKVILQSFFKAKRDENRYLDHNTICQSKRLTHKEINFHKPID